MLGQKDTTLDKVLVKFEQHAFCYNVLDVVLLVVHLAKGAFVSLRSFCELPFLLSHPLIKSLHIMNFEIPNLLKLIKCEVLDISHPVIAL